jgi:hypothetical protein
MRARKYTVAFAVLVALAAMLLSRFPHAALRAEERTPGRIGLPMDWSTRHLIFTNGGSPENAVAAARDPRSWMHWAMRSSYLFPPDGIRLPAMPAKKRMHADWAMPLGTTGGMPLGETPAKYSFNITGTPSCTNDFVVYTIAAAPSATQANIIAFNNLYTGTASSSCPNGPQKPPTTDLTQPTVMWSYEVGTGAVNLSPVLSMDGTKVAFVESATHAMFDVLTWASGQGTSATAPVVPGSGSSVVRLDYTNTTTAGCTANASTDADSSAYVDYINDAAYVGADNGELYRITGVFRGTPTLDYCITVTAGASLTSPVYNSVNNTVYVSDGHSVFAYTAGATGFTLVKSIAVADTAVAGNPIILSPIVDSTNGFVYVFSSADATNAHSIVSQMNLALTSQVNVDIGLPLSSNVGYMMDGDFDNAYFTAGPTSGAGTLYACGTEATNSSKPSLYALSFSSPNGTINTTPAMSDNRNINTGTPNGSCSPLLDFFDGTTDRLFVGAGSDTGTTGSNMVTEWNVNTRIASNTTTPTATATGQWGGTSAFTIDNVSTTYQAASIYFGTLRPPPNGTTTPCGTKEFCAVKLTQTGLQ